MRVLIRAISTIMKMKIKFSWAKKKKPNKKHWQNPLHQIKSFKSETVDTYEILIIY